MKILFTRFPLESRKAGGAETQTITLMEGLRKHGHAVTFAGSCPALLERCREKGIPTVELRIGPPPVTPWGAVSFLWRKRSMRRALEETLRNFSDLDAIVMLSLSEKLLLTDIAASRGIRVFWLEHDPLGRWLTANPWLPCLKRMSAGAVTITVSELSRKLYLGLGFDPARVVAIPNGIDLRRFSSSIPRPPPPAEEGRGVEEMRIGTIARLDHEKGLDLLIRAVHDLPGTSLTIVGTGKQEKLLRSLISSYTTNSKTLSPTSFVLCPSIPDLPSFYQSLHVFVLPSRTNDPFGLVAAEAMSLGVPVIVSDACGIAGYLKDGESAVVVRAGDAQALREGIAKMLNPSARKAIGEAGRAFSRENFSAEKMIERYDEALRASSRK